jgi:lipocalin
MKVVVIVITLFLFQNALAVEYNFGGCPKVQPLHVSAMENFTGVWYDVMKYSSMFVKGKCMSFDVEEKSNTTIEITSSEINNGEMINVTRTGAIDESGGLEFNFTFLKINAKFYILDVDNKHYLVAFACRSAIKLANVQMACVI